MTRRTITGCDAVHPDRRGGQHVAKPCAGAHVIDEDTGIGVSVRHERSQDACIQRANELLDGIIDKLTKGGA